MDDHLYKKAKKRVKAKIGFFNHLKSYLIINAIFIFISATEGDPFESLPVAFFWGIGLVSHYIKVFGLPGNGIWSKDWEEEEVEREMKRLQQKKEPYLDLNKRKSKEELDMDEHLELKEMRKNYDDSELV